MAVDLSVTKKSIGFSFGNLFVLYSIRERAMGRGIFFAGTWRQRIAAIALLFAISAIPKIVFLYWHVERGVYYLVDGAVFMVACGVAKYIVGSTGLPSVSVVALSFVGLIGGGLSGHAAAVAFHFGPTSASLLIAAGGTIASIGFIVAYAIFEVGSKSTHTRLTSFPREHVIDDTRLTSCPIDKR